jgi:CBS domain-containing protein
LEWIISTHHDCDFDICQIQQMAMTYLLCGATFAEGVRTMKARDVMVSPVIIVTPNSSVRELAQTLLKNRISAVPVVDSQGLVGIVSEGDLLHRSEAGTERRQSRGPRLITRIANETRAAEYIKAHSRKVADIMVRNVVTADPEAPLDEIAILMEQNSIKRVRRDSSSELLAVPTSFRQSHRRTLDLKSNKRTQQFVISCWPI